MFKKLPFILFVISFFITAGCTTVTVVSPTATPENTTTTPTTMGTVTATAMVPGTATATLEPIAQTTITPTVAATAVGPTIIVIEGPVTAINNNIITIFDIDIQIESNDPILTIIHVGDIIRVEGENTFNGNTIVVVAVNVTIIHSTVIIINNNNSNNNNGPSLPPGCKVTGKGKIKCSKKSSRR